MAQDLTPDPVGESVATGFPPVAPPAASLTGHGGPRGYSSVEFTGEGFQEEQVTGRAWLQSLNNAGFLFGKKADTDGCFYITRPTPNAN